MSLLQTLRFVTGHPLNRRQRAAAVLRYAKWQLGGRLVPGKVIHDWIGGAKIVVRPGDTGLTGNIYCGLHEFPEMAYVLHVLAADDLFADIGANAGSYTVLACAVKGARGICFEPVPATFARLMENIRVNDLTARVEARNIGLSDEAGALNFTSLEDCTNHVMAAGEQTAGAISVPTLPLDQVLGGRVPAVIKMDVEGFETPVLRGARATLANPALHSVIMELNGSGTRYGFDEAEILRTMLEHGFSTYAYEPFARRLEPLGGKNAASGNTLFIRDRDLVAGRIGKCGPIAFGRVTF